MAFAYDEVYDEMKKTTATAPKNTNEPKKVWSFTHTFLLYLFSRINKPNDFS